MDCGTALECHLRLAVLQHTKQIGLQVKDWPVYRNGSFPRSQVVIGLEEMSSGATDSEVSTGTIELGFNLLAPEAWHEV